MAPALTEFTDEQLEGRALEHAFARLAHGRACPTPEACIIRMKDPEGRWSSLSDTEDHRVSQIARRMHDRAKDVRDQLLVRGYRIVGADSPLRLSGEVKPRSVDLRMTNGDDDVVLAELKWTRKSKRTALGSARSSYPWLRRAAFGSGRWLWGAREPSAGDFVAGLGVNAQSWAPCTK